jgi:hypothetical protein
MLGHYSRIYAAYEIELKRIWPLKTENRKAKIEQFAKEHGFRLPFYRPGLCAIFTSGEKVKFSAARQK